MRFSIFPKETNFFDMFDRLAAIAVEASNYFFEITSKGIYSEEVVSKMQDIEHRGDQITHAIIDSLNKTFITPFDREDIHALANELDSIVDMLNTMTNRMRVYRISGVNNDLVEFAEVLKKSTAAVELAVKALRDTKNLMSAREHCIEINRLENAGDRMRDNILGKLFDNVTDPIYLIKWKEIIIDAETTLDICEDVANVIESIIVKWA
jgi:predicted phosphate transport protein (TIGR00153 family)